MSLSFNKSSDRNLSDQFPILYQNRFCDQKEFSIAVFSCESDSRKIRFDKPFLLSNFDTNEYLPNVIAKPCEKTTCGPKTLVKNKKFKSLGYGADIYFYNQCVLEDTTSYNRRYLTSTSMYSFANKNWKNLPAIVDEQSTYYACSFMQKLFLLCEKNTQSVKGNTCVFYDKKTNEWTHIASMTENRKKAACTVYKGKIVLSGGYREVEMEITLLSYPPQYRTSLEDNETNSVEAYDHHENKWYSFPSMLSPRYYHSAVCISNKMFMVSGSDSSEVFDSVTRKFTYIETLQKRVRTLEVNPDIIQLVGIGHEIYLFRKVDNKVDVHSYDVRNNLFSFKTSMEIEYFKDITYTKVPMI